MKICSGNCRCNSKKHVAIILGNDSRKWFYLKCFRVTETKHDGNLFKSCDSFIDLFWMSKEKLTRAGFEPATSALTWRRSTNGAITSPIGSLPILSISLLGGGGGGGPSPKGSIWLNDFWLESNALDRSAATLRWLKIIPHMIRSYYCCILLIVTKLWL